MKLNKYQKLVLVLYSLAFIYFCILHVPFKIKRGNQIAYDTLFSNRSNLDFGRLVLIIFVTTVVSFLLFLLFKNVQINFQLKRISKRISIAISALILISLMTLFVYNIIKNHSQHKTSTNSLVTDTSVLPTSSNGLPIFRRTDTSLGHNNEDISPTEELLPPPPKKMGSNKNEEVPAEVLEAFGENPCTKKIAWQKFKEHMQFYYPDWKIYGKPVVKEVFDCKYEVQFTTSDPHIPYLQDKEVMVLSVEFMFGRYIFKGIRGNLY